MPRSHVILAQAGIQTILILRFALVCALVVILCANDRTSATAQAIPLRYGQAISAAKSIFSLPIFVGEREGFFRREGLDFKIIIPIPGGSDKMIDALHDDTVDVTHVAVPFLIRAALNGSDAVAIAAEFTNPIYSLVAKPEIKSFADLKGKLLGLADEAGTITISTRKLLALRGVRAGDFRVKIIEGTPTRWNCLKRGECDAVPLGQPQDLIAQKEGFRVLGVSNDAVPDFLYTVSAVRKSWAEKNRDAVVRYLRGLSTTFKFIRDPANRKAVVKTIVETTDTPADIAQQTLMLFFEPERNVLPKQGEINVKARGDTNAAYAMMTEAGRKKTDAATFNTALAPFAKAGITEWRPTSLTVANKAMGYDSDFGFYREMKTTVVGGVVKTRHSGLFAVNFYLVGFGDAWQVHGFQVKSLPPEPGTAMNEPRKG